MATLSVFNFISLDGYYKGLNEDIGWHNHDVEETEYSAQSLQADSILLFGRVTYDMMFSFWPSAMAIQNMPQVARGMNDAEKIVFSNTMQTAEWNNTRVISGDIVEEVRKLKLSSAKDLTILGSGTILNQFTDAGIIDDYQLMISPIAIGEGTPIFKGIKQNLNLRLINSRIFKNGTLLLDYKPI